MGQIQVLILSCIFFLMIIQGVNANEIYTPNSYTKCDSKSCTITTYSIPRYAQEDKQWKEIEDVRSLKDKGILQLNVFEEDKEFPLEVIDYNLTSVTVELKKWAIFNTAIPIRVWENTGEKVSLDYKDKLRKVNEEEVVFNLFDLGKQIRTYDFNVGDVLEFGYNSTSITFNYTFEYIGVTIRYANPTENYNALTLMNISNQNYGRHAIVGFNISLGDYTQIDNAEMGFYISENLIDFGESLNVSTHHIYSWANITSNVSWNTQPTPTTEWNLTPTHTNFYNNTIINQVTRFNVTQAMRNEHSNKTFTAFLRSTHSGVNTATGTLDYITFLNKGETGDIDNYPYLNITYSADDTSGPTITKVSQVPADLDTNLFDDNITTMNITLSISDESGVNTSSIYLRYNVTRANGSPWYFINGTAYNPNINKSYVSNSSDNFLFQIEADYIYPHTVQRDHSEFEYMPHNIQQFGGNSEWVKLSLDNISSSDSFAYLEFMANASSLGSLDLYVCNSTYTTGSPKTSNACGLLSSAQGTSTFNHIHGNLSKHNVFVFTINNSMIDGVKITNTMQFLGNSKTGDWYAYYIPNATKTGYNQYSNNGGSAWSDINSGAGTWDAHLHQFTINDTLKYSAYACDNLGYCSSSAIFSDLIDFGNQPPSTPLITTITSTTYTGIMDINYTTSYSPKGYSITYNLTLNNIDESFNYSIVNANTGLNYQFNSSFVINGTYIMGIQAIDEIGQKSGFYYTDQFNISNNFTSPPPPTPSNVTTSCGLNYSGLIIGNSSDNKYLQLCKGDNFF